MLNLASICFVMMLSLNPDGSVSLSNDSYSGGPLPEGVSIVDSSYALPAGPEYLTHSNGVVVMRSQAEIDAINATKTAQATQDAIQKASDTVAGMSQTLTASTNRLEVQQVLIDELFIPDPSNHLHSVTVAGGSLIPVQVSASPEVGKGVRKKREAAKVQSIEAAALAIQTAGPNPGNANIKADLIYAYMYALTASVTNIVTED